MKLISLSTTVPNRKNHRPARGSARDDMHGYGSLQVIFLRTGLGFLFVFLLAGCAFVRGNVGNEFGDETVAAIHSIEKGVTTRKEVGEKLGAPDEIVNAVGRDIFHYRYFDGKLGWLLLLSRLNIASDNLYVFFDESGVVEDVIFGKRTDQLEFQIWPFGE